MITSIESSEIDEKTYLNAKCVCVKTQHIPIENNEREPSEMNLPKELVPLLFEWKN